MRYMKETMVLQVVVYVRNQQVEYKATP